MPINRDVTITGVAGGLKIRNNNGVERDAKNRDSIKPDEVVYATKRSAAKFKGDGFTIACVTNEKGKNGTRVITRHPLARYAKKPKQQSLKATILKVGGRLIIQAQREDSKGVRCYNLSLDLSGQAP